MMKRLLVYSHDTYGLGNIRRMLSICTYLIDHIEGLSILVISSSPMIHSLPIPRRLDYLKLPCLTRTEGEGYSVKYLNTNITETIKLRSELIRSAVINFKPDLFLVDKKPFGIKNELEASISYIQLLLHDTRMVLLLRDILDKPESTIAVWEKNKYHEIIRRFYDHVLVVGSPEIFDVRKEYRFPKDTSKMLSFCGYIKREPGRKSREAFRKAYGLKDDQKLVLVTPGGGQDGYRLLQTYISGLGLMPKGVKSLVISGPEMPEHQREALSQATLKYPSLVVWEFTDDMMACMDAADLVISMGGYNTICEILTLKKQAIIVPRVKPVEEQLIRAERMARLGFFHMIHPDALSPESLYSVLIEKLQHTQSEIKGGEVLQMGALSKISHIVSSLLFSPMRIDQESLMVGPRSENEVH